MFDPVFSDNASPLFFGVSRFQKPIIPLDSLPKIDWIIISHDHYDHLDMETIEYFVKHQPQIEYATPLGVSSHLWEWEVPKQKTHELDWWETLSLGDSAKLHCTPSQHFSGRVIPRSNLTLWSSWVIDVNGQKLFYSGDTGYSDHFKEINKKYGPFEVAFMENGQYNYRWAKIHLLPPHTVQAFEDLHAKHMVSVHWGMFSLGPHAWYEPIEETSKLTNEKKLSHLTPKIGELVIVTDSVHFSPWWKKSMELEQAED